MCALQGLEGEWKLWQETGLGYPVSYQMVESSQGAAEERRVLDLGPNVGLRPAGPERTEAPPAQGGPGSAERPKRPDSADRSARPDLEHPWDDPYDEAAAMSGGITYLPSPCAVSTLCTWLTKVLTLVA